VYRVFLYVYVTLLIKSSFLPSVSVYLLYSTTTGISRLCSPD